ncbi:hypothetical protein JXA85_05085, partial [Candidatus Woesearchaeota archaeon]|nr:hypothetical protein [Candidatus Woesearchaeota archaeon]
DASVIKICSCQIAQTAIVVRNTGTTDAGYAIESTGKTKGTISFIPFTFSLKPGDEKEVQVYIKPECGKRGKLSFEADIKSSSGITKSLEIKVEAVECQNIEVKTSQLSLQSCPCQPQAYAFEVTNTGSYNEGYFVKTVPESPYVNVSADFIVLAPDQKMLVYAYVTAPCEIHGDLSYSMKITADHSNFEAITPFNLLIKPCYDYGFEFGKYAVKDKKTVFQKLTDNRLAVCEESYMVVPFLMSNTVNFSNSYLLSISGPDFSYLDKAELTLKKNQQGIFNLFIVPGMDTEGIYNITVEAKSKAGDLVKSQSLYAEIGRCFDYSIDIEKDSDKTCCIAQEYKVTVKNNMDSSAKFNLSIDGPAWASLDNSAIEVAAKKEKSFMLNINPDCENLGKEEIKVIARLSQPYAMSSREDKITLDIASQEKCFDVDLRNRDSTFNSKKIINLYEEKTTRLAVESNGLFDGRYKVTIDGPDWIRSNVSVLELETGNEIDYYIRSTPLLQEVDPGNYPFKVIVSPPKTNISFGFDMEIEVREKNIFDTLKSYSWYIVAGLILLIIIIIVLARLPPRAPKKEKKEKKPKKEKEKKEKKAEEITIPELETHFRREEKKHSPLFKIMVTVLIILVLGLGILVFYYLGYFNLPAGHVDETPSNVTTANYSKIVISVPAENITKTTAPEKNVTPEKNITPEEPKGEPEKPEIKPIPGNITLVEGVTHFVIDENGQLEINLSKLFNDPDSDKLRFTSTMAEHIQTEIDGSIMTAVPEKDWLGWETIQIFATDGKSFPAESPPIVLEVKKSGFKLPEFGLLQFVKDYSTYFLIGFAILIAAIIIISLTEEEKPKKKK